MANNIIIVGLASEAAGLPAATAPLPLFPSDAKLILSSFASCSACLGLCLRTQEEACCGWTLASAVGMQSAVGSDYILK